MSTFDDNLKKLNIILPDPKGPVGAYVATKIVGKLLFISGQVSIDKNAKLITGKIGKDLNLEQGYMAAERCGLSIICLLYTSPSPRDNGRSRMPSSA